MILKETSDLMDVGFEQDEFGPLRATGCCVTFYHVGHEWEIYIKLPNGGAVSFDIPLCRVRGRISPNQQQANVRDTAKANNVTDLNEIRQARRNGMPDSVRKRLNTTLPPLDWPPPRVAGPEDLFDNIPF